MFKQLQKSNDLADVNQELCAIWNAVDHYSAMELLVTVYKNFLRNIYSTLHIYFFVQSSRIIDRVINGDSSSARDHNLAEEYIQVERVVDIVEAIFKTSSALSLFENTTILEIEYSRLQSIIQSILSNVNIAYKNG